MKTTINSNKSEFKPVSITITFETQKELDDFGCLCNARPIMENVNLPSYSELEKMGADIDTNIDNILKKIRSHPAMKKT